LRELEVWPVDDEKRRERNAKRLNEGHQAQRDLFTAKVELDRMEEQAKRELIQIFEAEGVAKLRNVAELWAVDKLRRRLQDKVRQGARTERKGLRNAD